MYFILIYAFFKLIHIFVQQFLNSIGDTILVIFEYGIYIILFVIAATTTFNMNDMYDSRWSNEVVYQYKLCNCLKCMAVSFTVCYFYEFVSKFIILVYYYI